MLDRCGRGTELKLENPQGFTLGIQPEDDSLAVISPTSAGGTIFELCLEQASRSGFPGLGPLHHGWGAGGAGKQQTKDAGDLAFLWGVFTPVEFN